MASNKVEDHALEALGHAIAGGIAGMATVTLTSPFSIVSTRLAVQQKKIQQGDIDQTNKMPYKNTMDAFKRMFSEEGWESFYSGLQAQLIGIGASSFVYYYLYSFLKSHALKKKQELGTVENLLIAAASGCGNVISTIPIWVVYTRLQLNPNKPTIWEQFKIIYKESGVPGLYKGLIPSLILVSNPSIQFVVYEKLKTFWKLRSNRSRFTGFEIFILGAIAKLVAAVVTYPILLIKTTLQAQKSKDVSLFTTILNIYKSSGFFGFFRGMVSKLAQSVLGSAFLFLVKEKISIYTILILYLIKRKLFAKRK
ncbi:transmembrane protein [Tieghemostelium lacteum]|uniref:Transmembrane protein n=1 Tax=Tieghemostelium lacteum TaxID=361077 RepID=A0A152A0A5_TIELA|nr:transmembrane protein [Tieghemostelium lacteum]|eukprot:KYQ99638.1 transmembrane protein [Tieghemostelium lacteum]